MSEHTPTPWVLVPPNEIVRASRIADHTGVHNFVPLQSPWREGAFDDNPEAEANMAFIVLAVNSHQQLIDALKDIIRADDEFRASLSPKVTDRDPVTLACDRAKNWLALAGLDAAIARAGEKL